MSDLPVFEMRQPGPGMCCLCRSTEGPFSFEKRPTGRDLGLQDWPYCPSCWACYQAEAKSTNSDPAVIARYLVLARCIVNGKGLEFGHTSVKG